MNSLSATYDQVDNRVALDVTSEPNIQCVSISRQRPDGCIYSIPSLRYAPVNRSGATRLYDYAAPLNQTITYRATFLIGPVLHPDSIEPALATVATTDNRHWVKRPVDWPRCDHEGPCSTQWLHCHSCNAPAGDDAHWDATCPDCDAA